MAIEIERKFLVQNLSCITNAPYTEYRQGYLTNQQNCTVRARIAGDKAFLTIKGKPQKGMLGKLEFEYLIPMADCNEMLSSLAVSEIISKKRYLVQHKGFTWEIDLFSGSNEGLIIAEIELSDEEQEFPIPDWVGEEVSHDKRYYNAYIAAHPFNTW
ncbi:MAG: CYTH domain-containing protein [Desulfotalea sp.]